MNWKNKPVAILIGLLLIHVIAHIDRNLLSGFAPQITADLALNNKQFGFLTGAVWVLSFGFMAIFMGSLADRFSRTRVIAFGVLVWSLCTAASGYANSFEQMVLARFFVATGEAALVPAAVSLLAEVFSAQRRSTAVGVFFIGIPLGIGLAFVIAGTLGVGYGWRGTFMLLGGIGAVFTVPLLLLKDQRDGSAGHERGAPFAQQVRAVVASVRESRPLRQTMTGFVLIHFAFASLAFVQLWLVRERGFDGATIAKQMGLLQILFGTLGAVLGGVASDRFSRRFKGGHATVLSLMVLLLAPLMLAYRFATPGSALFFIGMCAGFILPLATYGPANALIQALTPVTMRSTITGATMMLINVFAIAIGNLAVGAVSDRLTANGSAIGLTVALVATDVLVACSLWFFWRAAISGNTHLADAVDKSAVPVH
jgi:predicted MFS family arabinose efflux permease